MADNLEKLIQTYSIHDFEDHPEINTPEIFNLTDLEYIASGLLARVFRVKNTNWVLKESRWDMQFTFSPDKTIALPSALIQAFLEPFAYKFLPQKDAISEQRKLFQIFIEYFGFFNQPTDFPVKNFSLTKKRQQKPRRDLGKYIPELEAFYAFKIIQK